MNERSLSEVERGRRCCARVGDEPLIRWVWVSEIVSRLRRRWLPALLVATMAAWWWIGQGLVSSNDGSHLALGRALILRGETRIDPDESLTLWVDRAHHDGRVHSDRPPGTAFAALPAIWVGARLDPVLLQASKQRGQIVYMPATPRYVETYGIRRQRNDGAGPPLSELQGTAAMLTAQAAMVGTLGLWAVVMLLRRKGVDARGQVFALVTMAFATLWGPYSTALFSHVTAGTALALLLLTLELGRDGTRRLDLLAGLAGGWAIATDYALVLVVIPLVVLEADRRRWPMIALGVLPIGVATALYHQAAFGSPWAIGYDHHAAFAFTHERMSTFSGNPLDGLWTLFGFGRGAGLAALSPIVFVGFAGVLLAGRARSVLPLVPWGLVLLFHRTPWGGDTVDHRYLVPALPWVGVGLGLAWQKAQQHPTRHWLAVLGILVVTAASVGLVWTHFVAWRAG
jgi:hypothetical protein